MLALYFGFWGTWLGRTLGHVLDTSTRIAMKVGQTFARVHQRTTKIP